MWVVSKGIWIITIAPMVLIGVGMVVWGFFVEPDALTEDGLQLYWLGLFFIIFPLLSALAIYLFYKRVNDREEYLMKNGLRCEAEILSRQQTGTYVNEQPEVLFRLKIRHPYQPAYELEHKAIVSLLDAGSIPPGKLLQVMVDPKNPKNIMLVF